jgi:non-homologous end joining protein Ku
LSTRPTRSAATRVDKDVYIQVDDEEIEALEVESNHTIDIDSFVPRAQIDERYHDSTYYIAPNDQVGREAFAVIREAMRGKDMVALGRIVLAKRERVIALQPWENGLLGTTLRYAYEVRNASEYFDEIPTTKIPKDMLQLAEHILESKAGDFDPAASSTTTKKRWSRCSSTSRPARRCRKQKAAAPALERRQPDGRTEAQHRGGKRRGQTARGQEGQVQAGRPAQAAAVQIRDRGGKAKQPKTRQRRREGSAPRRKPSESA